MTTITQVIPVATRRREEMVNLGPSVREMLGKIGATDGMLHLFVPHTTAAVTINECADPDVPVDMVGFLNRLVPLDASFRHLEGNSDAHIKSTLVGVSLWVPVREGVPALGRWQTIFFCEFDGPRQREVHARFFPDVARLV